MQSKLIILDGLDGCGKSTQLDLLKEVFPECRFLTFPNYNSQTGEIISDYLAGNIPNPEPLNHAYSASSFYAVDRYISYRKDWYVDYTSGKNIISARYTTSNAIYQMTKLPQSEWENFCQWLYDYEYYKLGIPAPDAVLFLDMPIEVSQRLLSERYQGDENKKDIHESDIDFLKRCRESALYVAEHDAFSKWHFIPCAQNEKPRTIEAIHNDILQIIRRIMSS